MMRDPRALPRLIFYKKMEIDYGTVRTGVEADAVAQAKETFTFNLDAGMALESVTDMSGNTTEFVYGDTFNRPGELAALFTIGGYCGRYQEPTSEKKTLWDIDVPNTSRIIQKTFRYESRGGTDTPSRILAQTTDGSGRTVTYTIDPLGRRTGETIAGTGGGIQETKWDYEDSRFPGVATRKTIRKQAGDVSASSPIVTEYVLNNSGLVAQETVDPGGLNIGTLHTYDGNGNKLSTTDPRGHLTGFSYDACNRLTKVEYPGKTTKEFVYTAAGDKIRETDENGHVTTYKYDGVHRVVSTEGGGAVTLFGYNSVGSRATVTDPLGNVTRTDFDKLQRPEKVTDAKGNATSFWYGTNSGSSAFDVSAFKPTRIQDPRGIVTSYTFDSLYRQCRKTVEYSAGATATWQTYYDDSGNPVREVDPRLKDTWKEYDAANRLVKVKYHNPLEYEENVYNTLGQLWEKKDVRGHVTRYAYDAAGRATKVTSLGVKNENLAIVDAETITKYDPAGNISEFSRAREVGDSTSVTTKYFYDARNRKVKEVRPTVQNGRGGPMVEPTLKFAYDNVGNLIASVDARGGITVQSYDRWNRPVVVQQPFPGDRTTRFYDKNGNVTKVTDGNGNSVRNKYDEVNRLIQTTDSEDITVRYGYDAVGNETWVKDGLNQTTSFDYDGLNRNTVVRDATNKEVVFAYDGVNKVKRTDSIGRETNYGYDDRNRLKTVSYTGRSQDNLTYNYDVAGNATSVQVGTPAGSEVVRNVAYTYDAMGRVETETSVGTTHEYRYDVAGNRRKMITPGGRTLDSTYDGLNRLVTLNDSGLITTYSYDQSGNVVAKELPNGDLVQTTYNAANRQESISGYGQRTTANPGGVLLYKYTLAYDRPGNLLTSTELYSGAIVSRLVTLKYDRANRLIEEKAVAPAGETITKYAYNAANNRTLKSVLVNGSSTQSSTYLYNKLNQLTNATSPALALTYDNNGNRATRTLAGATDIYSYDYENRLVGLTKGGMGFSYKYDYRTRRVERVEGGATTHAIFSGGTSVREGLRSGTSWSTSVDHIRGSDWGGGVGGILYSVRSGGTSYAHYNSRGDVTTRTDPSGTVQYQAAYEAFGTRPQEDGSTVERQKANTKEEDPTGLLNEGFRYRDLETGTFLTRDPAGFVDGPNLYAYVRQNPWSKFDPEGLFVSDLIDIGFILYDGYKYSTAKSAADKALYGANLAVDFAGLAVDGADFGTGGGTAVIVAGRAAVRAKHLYQAGNAGLHATEIVAKAGEKRSGSGKGSDGNPSGKSGKDSKELSEHDVGGYGDQKKLSGPGLNRDHIPSKAALIYKAEQEAGRALTEAEKKEIIDNGTSIAVNREQHQQASPTYGGRNTREQIEADAKDLNGAQERDLEAHISASKDKDAARRAADEVRRRNSENGVTN